MTSPGGPGVVGTPGGLVGTNGLPNFGGISTSPTGAVDIWNIPSDLQGQRIWFDTTTGTKDTYETTSGDLKPGQPIPKAKVTGTTATSNPIYLTPQQLMAQFYGMSKNDPQKFYDLQAELAMFPGTSVQPTGVMDKATDSALVTAMQGWTRTVASGVAIPFRQYLSEAAQTAMAHDPKTKSTGPQVTLMDPANIRDRAQAAAVQALGQGLSSSQLDAFVNQFQSEQIANAQKGGGDLFSTNTKLPGEAMAYVQKADPKAYMHNKASVYMDTLVNMFAPTGSQRPNVTPADFVPSIQGSSG